MQNIIDILKKSDALLEGHFLLSSGMHSNRYVQCAKVLRFPDMAEEVLKPAIEKVKDLEIDLVVGPAMGGVVVAYEVGRQLKKEAIFTERVDNIMNLRRGFEVKKGDRIIITEDVVTTGKSTMEVKRLLESMGGIVLGVLCIVDRRGETSELDIPVYSSIKLEIQSFDKDNCELCKSGSAPIKPGSRKMD